MSLYDKWYNAFHTKDIEAAKALLHEDYTFVRHQTGTTMNKTEMSGMLAAFMSSEDVVVHSQRCIYENDEILVEHSVMDFADGSREAVMGVSRLKDGLIIHTETGATPIAK